MKYSFSFVLLAAASVLCANSHRSFPVKEPENKVALGEMLFHEKRLSKNNRISCASCHIPEFAFADTVRFSIGADGLPGKRNTPTVMNVSVRPYFFYDGRVATLEDQVSVPIEDHLEMNMQFMEACKKVTEDSLYQVYFKKIYGSVPDAINIRDAIAAFERSLETSDTPFDRWMNGDTAAMGPSAIRGRELFMDEPRTKCFSCHFSPDFTGDEFRNIGLYDGKNLTDAGRFEITGDSSDIGKFKTPGLRNIAVTPPYMHNGMFSTLREVLVYYNDPYKVVPEPVGMDSLMLKPLGLSEEELFDLESFLRALTDDRFSSKVPAEAVPVIRKK